MFSKGDDRENCKGTQLFLVAVDKSTGKLAGFLNGVATDEEKFRDEFFTDIDLCDENGKNVMLLGLDVLTEWVKSYVIKDSGAGNFDLATAKAALENLYELYKNGLLTGRFTQDKDYVARCADLVILAEENKDSLFYDAWRIWFRYFVSMGYAGWNELWEAV